MKELLFISASFILSLIIIKIVIIISNKFKLYDIPDNILKTHKRPVPWTGGTAIIFLFFIILFYFFYYGYIGKEKTILIATTSFLIYILGIVDDKKNLSPYTKLFFQFLISLIIAQKTGIDIKFFRAHFQLINYTLSILWIMTLINAFNIIDILDGLCSGITILILITIIIIAKITGSQSVFYMAVALIIPVSAFYIFNFPPAKLFLGNSGSMMIGLIISILTIEISYTSVNIISLIIPVMITGLPLYDLILVSIFRILKKKSPLRGSKDHFALRLMELNFSLKKILTTFYMMDIFLAINAIIMLKSKITLAALIFINTIIGAIILGLIVHKIDKKSGNSEA